MFPSRIARMVISCVLCALPLAAAPPQRMLWVWQVDDDLRFLSRNEAGVAWLAMTIFLDGATGAAAEPRANILRLPPGAYEMPVIRLERDPQSSKAPAWSAAQRAAAVRMIVDLARITHAHALQIDFDAPESARPFYRSLLTDMRRELGPDVFLSITALLSWCATPQSWLDNLPVNEIVPMAFDPGVRPGAGLVVAEDSRADPVCRKSIGIGVELPIWWHTQHVTVRPGQRVYFLTDGSWTRARVGEAFSSAR